MSKSSAARNLSSERRCFVTRSARKRDHLIRFVVDSCNCVLPDIDERLPGRGMWLSAERDVLNKAVEKRLFGRAAGQSVGCVDGLADQVEGLLTRRFHDALGLSRRAGQIVMGFEQAQAVLTSAKAALLLQAADGAEDGRRKLRHLASEIPLIMAGSRREIGSAVGREELVHAALPPGKLAERVLRDAMRLSGFRADVAVEGAGLMAPDMIEPKGTTEKP
ncbi:MAG: RNA-binding protein [Geminicoccaceae bacterium]